MSGTDMSLDADDCRVIDYFTEPTRVTERPIIQRDYEWSDEQWEELWNDLITLTENPTRDTHHIGQFILIDTEDNSIKKHQPVDGLHRITTLSIILCAARDVLDDSNHHIENCLHTHTPSDDTVRSLQLLGQDDADYARIYDSNIHGINEESLLRQCYEFYRKRFEALEDDEKVNDVISETTHNVNLVCTTTNNTLAAYRVFRTQHDRGKPISKIDLAHTRLIEVAREAGLNEEDMSRRWNTFCDILDNNDEISRAAPQRAITHFLITDDNYDTEQRITKKDFFAEFADALAQHETAAEIREFLSTLERYTDLYVDIHEGTVRKYAREYRQDISQGLFDFRQRNARGAIVLLYLVENIDDGNELLEALRLVNTLNVRLNLGDQKGAHQRDTMYQLVDSLKDVDTHEQRLETIESTIEERTKSNDKLRQELLTREFPNSPFTRSVLLGVEEHLNQATNETEIRVHDIELEHIGPRNAFNADRHTPWRSLFENDEDKFEQYKKRLGNLTLFSNDQNPRSQDEPFQGKCERYRASGCQMTCNIPEEYDSWGFGEIDDRTESLTEDILRVWSV